MDKVFHTKAFFDKEKADTYMTQLQYGIEWNSPNTYFHRHYFRYDYLETHSRIPVLDNLIVDVEHQLDVKIIGAFCNYYKDGNDYTPYHKDSCNSDIITVSFGESRDFYFKHDKTGERTHIELNDGDLIYFPNSVNKDYKHSIPIRKKSKNPRISIVLFIKNS